MRRPTWSDRSEPFAGYSHLQEAFAKWWHEYARTCEMGTFAPVWVLDQAGYELIHIDREVWDLRESYHLCDDYQFYDELIGDAEVLEIWGHTGYGNDEEACLLYRNYGTPEYEESSFDDGTQGYSVVCECCGQI